MSSENEREYWIAGGADKEKAEAFIRERAAAQTAQIQVATKYGGTAISAGSSIVGLMFDGDQKPAGWTKKGELDGRPYFMPMKITKALKAIYAELTEPRMKGASAFHSLLCAGNGGVMAQDQNHGRGWGMRILYSTWEFIGDTLLLCIPVGSDFTPDGSRKLAMSEYWAMREAADKRAAA